MFLFLASPLGISLLVFFSCAWGARSLLQWKPPLWGTSLESAHGTVSFSAPSSPPSSFAPCLCLLHRISACTTVPFPYHIPDMMAFCLEHAKLLPAHRCLHLLFTLPGRFVPVSFSSFISYFNNHLLRDTSRTSPPESVLHLHPATLHHIPLKLVLRVLTIIKQYSVFVYSLLALPSL